MSDNDPSLRTQIKALSLFRCGYCLTSERIVGPLLEIDHIMPTSRGGTDEPNNLVLACPICNGHKSNRTAVIDPETGESVPLFNPRTDDWNTHFRWTENGTVIVGKTAIGRAMVQALVMNHPDMVSARAMWVMVGWHPPDD